MNIRDFRRVFTAIRLQAYPRGSSLFVCTSPLAVITAVGFLDTRAASSSADFRSFLLIMCIDALESTTKYLYSGLVEDDAGIDQTPEGEQNVAVSFSLSLSTFFAMSHASLRAHRSCCKVSS